VIRTLAACVLSAGVGAAITGGVGLSASATRPQVKTITPRDTAIFTGQDLTCVNNADVACSSYASPYHGIGISITRTTILITRPPNVKVIATYKR
jgi:opacity protein-like surface antigen